MKSAMRKGLGLVLAALLACSLLPLSVYAEEGIPPVESTETPPSAETPAPTEVYTSAPVEITPAPTEKPAEIPTEPPTEAPTEQPTEEPTQAPTEQPTEEPTQVPTEQPTEEPTEAPTEQPTEEPTQVPTEQPTEEPTQAPTAEPTPEPTPIPERSVLTECVMDKVLKVGDEFILKVTLVGFEGVQIDLQWQLDTDDGRGFRDAPGESKALVYRVTASEETVAALWRIVVTVVE